MTEPRFKLLQTETELLPVTKDATSGQDVRPVRVIVSTSNVDRMGDIIVQEGIDLTGYKANPVVLWSHDPDCPIARAPDIGVANGKLTATAMFPAEGVDEEADYVYGKIKAGIVNAASIGFNPLEFQPIDPKQPWGGLKFTKSEMLEFSFVSVPANKDCIIVGRSIYVSNPDPAEEECHDFEDLGIKRLADVKPKGFALIAQDRLNRIMGLPMELRTIAGKAPAGGARGLYRRHANMIEGAIRGDSGDWKCGASRNLMLDMSDSWDGSGAAGRMLDAATDADGKIDAGKAKRGFLIYDAANPNLRGSYKEPFADIMGGELKAVAGGIRAAASRLPQTDAPADARDAARAVLDAYEAKINENKAMYAPEFKDIAAHRLRLLKAKR
ncbi:MAG TPA: HK97 family phage prohead protease [Terriglobia bacterium]|nr:HK97 family phage prohead protease [Terriglobia bacterium]